jgi:hypothetical protein
MKMLKSRPVHLPSKSLTLRVQTVRTQILTAMLATGILSLRAAIMDGPATATIQVLAGAGAETGGYYFTAPETASDYSPMNVSAGISNGDGMPWYGRATSSGSFSYSFTNTSFSESVQLCASLDGWAIAFGNTSSTWQFSVRTPTTFSLSGSSGIGNSESYVHLSLTQDGPNTEVYHYDSLTNGPSISGSVLLQPAHYTFQSASQLLNGNDVFVVTSYSFVASVRDAGGPPSLNIARSNAFVIVSWPVSDLNFQLQENTNLLLTNSWSAVAQPAVTNDAQISVTVPTAIGQEFFRLKSQ